MAKGIGGYPLSMLHSFYKHRMSMALQIVHVAPISRRTVTAREDLFRFKILFGLLPFSLINMFHVIGEGFGS
jgi:hypothetical protein